MAEQMGWRRYLHLKKETTWGTAVVPDVWIPYEAYDVRARPQPYSSNNNFTGVRQIKARPQAARAILNGSLSCCLYGYQVTSGSLKSLAQHLIELATNGGASQDLDSATIVAYSPNDIKRHIGVRCNSLTLSGSFDQSDIKLAMALEGKQEDTTSAVSLSAALPEYKRFLFKDATFSLAGVATELRSFSLSIENNLRAYHNNAFWPSLISAGQRVVRFQFSLFNTASTYDALRRATSLSQITGQLVLVGTHEGTAANNNTTLTIDIDQMTFLDADDQMSLNELDQQTVSYMINKPNTTDNDIDLTWGTS